VCTCAGVCVPVGAYVFVCPCVRTFVRVCGTALQEGIVGAFTATAHLAWPGERLNTHTPEQLQHSASREKEKTGLRGIAEQEAGESYLSAEGQQRLRAAEKEVKELRKQLKRGEEERARLKVHALAAEEALLHEKLRAASAAQAGTGREAERDRAREDKLPAQQTLLTGQGKGQGQGQGQGQCEQCKVISKALLDTVEALRACETRAAEAEAEAMAGAEQRDLQRIFLQRLCDDRSRMVSALQNLCHDSTRALQVCGRSLRLFLCVEVEVGLAAWYCCPCS
jgi:hypothetical protein